MPLLLTRREGQRESNTVPATREASKPMANIYVGNLPYSTHDAQLRQLFEEFGEVASAKVIIDRATDRSRGFGFVEMPDDADARAAMEALDGTELEGRTLRVSEAKPK